MRSGFENGEWHVGNERRFSFPARVSKRASFDEGRFQNG